MARLINALNPGELATLPEGEHCDGGGLYLCVTGHGGRSWLVKYQWAGKTAKMGLGSFTDVGLAAARKKAQKIRQQARDGINPKVDREQVSATARSSPTFLDYATEFTKTHVATLKNPKSVEKWWRAINVYCASLHNKQMHEITVDDVIAVLAPRWLSHPQAMKDCRQQLQAIFGAAMVKGHRSRTEINPAQYEDNLKHIPPFKKAKKAGKPKKNHPSMPYAQVPAFMVELRRKNTVAAWCLETLILTGVRTTEALQMQWSQIDFAERKWVLPGKVMKNDLEADIPLTDTVIARLQGIKELGLDSKYVFPGKKAGSIMSNNTMLKLLQQDLGRDNVTVHGFRSSFRSWGQDETEHSHETLEFCLHHITGDEAAKAYKNGNMWAKRMAAMKHWETFCNTRPQPKAVPAAAA
ncbi:tyrosine-type recombinase/integrase [Bradyrhizobium oligotrophicum]|uniref:tyrosine-type recombinase/integrase n=1 Tax=Bradyrhizobium TaxID=374 RepID=UPI003EBEE372